MKKSQDPLKNKYVRESMINGLSVPVRSDHLQKRLNLEWSKSNGKANAKRNNNEEIKATVPSTSFSSSKGPSISRKNNISTDQSAPAAAAATATAGAGAADKSQQKYVYLLFHLKVLFSETTLLSSCFL